MPGKHSMLALKEALEWSEQMAFAFTSISKSILQRRRERRAHTHEMR